MAELGAEVAGDGGLAVRAMTLRCQGVVANRVPVADDQWLVALRAVGAAAAAVVDIAGVNVVQAGIAGDLAGLGEGGRWCCRGVGHFPVRVEGREMQRHVRAEFAGDPLRQLGDFADAIVVAGDEQGGDFQPAIGAMVDVNQPIEHCWQVRAAELAVKVVGEGLEVDIGRIHHRKKLACRGLMDVARRHRHIVDAQLAAGEGGVDGVFGKNHRVVVGVGHALRAVAFGGLGDGLRAGGVHQAIHVFGARNVPVLAELAGEIAARRAKGKDAAAGVKVIEGFFLDGVDAKAGRAAIGGQLHHAILHAADKAGTALALVQLAIARAEVALDAPVRQRMPPAAWVGRFCGQHAFSFHFCTP